MSPEITQRLIYVHFFNRYLKDKLYYEQILEKKKLFCSLSYLISSIGYEEIVIQFWENNKNNLYIILSFNKFFEKNGCSLS